MSDESTTIISLITGRPAFNVVPGDGVTYLVNSVTGRAEYIINGDIAGGAKPMTTAERTAITPKEGELIWDSDQEVLYAGDGETAGGVQVSGTGGGAYTQGYGIEITGGATISRAAYGTIETVDVSGASPSVTMVPGHAYSINATTKAVTLNVASFNANQFGIDEGHLEIFVAGTGHVVTGANVELANALGPDAINYCTVRFVGGVAKIALEDNIGGYIVVSPTGTTVGTLPYALSSATSSYIAFDASLNGSLLDMGGATTNGEKHVVGNGYGETVLTGGVSCTSKTTFANLTMSGAAVTGGTMTLGDVYIPQSGTVTVSGGGLAIEKVTGAGKTSVIDLGGNPVYGNGTFSGVTLSGGTFASGTLSAVGGAVVELEMTSGTSMVFVNSNTVELVSGTSADLTLTSGAIVDLTGNANATPIAPGGVMTISGGGTQILTGSTAGVVEHTTTINGTGSFVCNAIASDGKINVASGKRTLSGELVISSASFTGSNATLSNAQNAVVTLVDCTNNAGYQTGSFDNPNGTVIVSGTFVGGAYQSFQGGTNIGTLILRSGATLTINGTYICAAVGTVIVDDNVVCNGTVTITGGTYHNCTIHKNGTITEA